MNPMETGASEVAVRTARPSDAHDVARLTAQLGYDVETEAVRARLAAILDRPDHRFLVAEETRLKSRSTSEERRVIGWLHAVVVTYIDEDPFVMIGGLVVDREGRRRGIGRTLMAHGEDWAREQGCSLVRLWSSEGRAAAHRFYRRVGYSHIKTQLAFARPVVPGAQEALKRLVPRLDETDA